jgi:hypothetical protein
VDGKWYENFFHGIALDVWRKAATPARRQLILPPAKVVDAAQRRNKRESKWTASSAS